MRRAKIKHLADPLEHWLQQLGLGQYAQALLDQDVTLDLMPELTSEDLKEIGITSIGHRRRLMSAAQIMTALEDTPPSQDVPTAADQSGDAIAEIGAEQRMVTAMFCDLVGSTRLATLVEPEEYRDIIAQFRDLISTTLVPYDGNVARFLGDGIVVFFGLGQSSEHDAENAVAAALDIVYRITGIDGIAGQKAQVRIGIATGLTVVQSSNPDHSQIQTDDTVVGEIPNLAARLQAETAPNTILVSNATRARLGDLFRLEDGGLLTLKGIEGGVQAWRVTGHAETDIRFDALRAQAPTTGFVGRVSELARLEATAKRALSGHGQVSVLTGDAGLGKSRLARELLVKTGMTPAEQPVFQCTPYHSSSPFHALRRYINRLLLDSTETSGRLDRSEKQGAFLAHFGLNTPENVTYLDDILSTTLAAQINERRALDNRYAHIAFLTDLFCAIAQDAGAVILEDLQWLDPSTSEVLARVADRLDRVQTHILCTMRPGPIPDWCQQAQADVLPLDRLAPADFGELVRSVARVSAPDITLSDAQIQEIATRSDGSPVFAEELTRFTLERTAEGGDTTDIPLPATLSDSLLARLDKLQTGRQLAQLGAVIGKEFPVDLLVSVSDLPKEEVLRGVESLIDAGIWQRGHSIFGAAVAFRHMLLKDAAYLTLLRRDRTAQHIRIANTMTRAFPDISAAIPQVVAHQLSKGGDFAHSVSFWERAGTISAGRSAYPEAIEYFRKAIDDCVHAPADLDLEEAELNVRLKLVAALISAHGFNTPDVHSEMPRIEALGTALQSQAQMLPLLVSKWVFLGASGQFAGSLEVARQISQTIDGSNEAETLLSLRCLGTSHFFSGNLEPAQTSLEQFFDLYDSSVHDTGLDRFGSSHHGAMSAVGLAELAVLACDDAGVDHWTDKAEALATASGQAHDLCHCTLFTGCVLPLLRGQLDVVEEMTDRLRSHSVVHDLPIWSVYADLFQGVVLMLQGRVQEGCALARPSIIKTQNSIGFLHFCLIFHAEACLHVGLTEEARDSYNKVGASILQQETWLSAEFGRIEAMIAHQEGRPLKEVLALLDDATTVATRQNAVLFQRKIAEFRATLD